MPRSKLSDFLFLEELGRGSYGIVRKVQRRRDKKFYVIKQIDINALSKRERDDAINEVNILASLDNQYVVKYFDSFIDQEKFNIVMELASHGSLHDLIARQFGTRLPENMIWSYFIQVLIGLHYIHKRRILHRDIKSLNIFLDSKDRVKLGDFGVAKVLTNTKSFAKTLVGTPYYLSPELCENKPYNEKSDIWALGCVLYELCTRKHPFDAANQGALILKIMRGRFPPIPQTYSASLREVLNSCLSRSTTIRPTAVQLLQLPSIAAKANALSISLPSIRRAPPSTRAKPQKRPPGLPAPRVRKRPGSESNVPHRPSAEKVNRGRASQSPCSQASRDAGERKSSAVEDYANAVPFGGQKKPPSAQINKGRPGEFGKGKARVSVRDLEKAEKGVVDKKLQEEIDQVRNLPEFLDDKKGPVYQKNPSKPPWKPVKVSPEVKPRLPHDPRKGGLMLEGAHLTRKKSAEVNEIESDRRKSSIDENVEQVDTPDVLPEKSVKVKQYVHDETQQEEEKEKSKDERVLPKVEKPVNSHEENVVKTDKVTVDEKSDIYEGKNVDQKPTLQQEKASSEMERKSKEQEMPKISEERRKTPEKVTVVKPIVHARDEPRIVPKAMSIHKSNEKTSEHDGKIAESQQQEEEDLSEQKENPSLIEKDSEDILDESPSSSGAHHAEESPNAANAVEEKDTPEYRNLRQPSFPVVGKGKEPKTDVDDDVDDDELYDITQCEVEEDMDEEDDDDEIKWRVVDRSSSRLIDSDEDDDEADRLFFNAGLSPSEDVDSSEVQSELMSHDDCVRNGMRDRGRKMNQLLDRGMELESTLASNRKECDEKIGQKKVNEILQFFKSLGDKESDEEESSPEANPSSAHKEVDISRFVFGRLAYEDAELIPKFYHMIYLEEVLEQVQKEIEGLANADTNQQTRVL